MYAVTLILILACVDLMHLEVVLPPFLNISLCRDSIMNYIRMNIDAI